jgi:XTP/dITP diphosphohydrolase
MSIFFITGNQGKFREAKAILPQIEQFDIDLPEIQHIDAKKIIQFKLKTAFKHKQTQFIVEDTSLYLDCLNGLPGPLIKWFEKSIGLEGIFQLCQKYNNFQVYAKTLLGYAKDEETIHFSEGIVKGKITSPIGDNGFGWDKIFIPDGFDKTFAQMTMEEKNQISMRKKALVKLKEYLNS